MMWITLLKTTQRMTLLACALKNMNNPITIIVLPTSMKIMLIQLHTTMMNNDGGCRCRGGQHFLRFYLDDAKETESG